MKRTLRFLLLAVFTGIGHLALAQNSGITGQVKDDKNSEVINAAVVVSEGGIQKGGTVTDYEGNYTLKPLQPGRYTVKISYQGREVNYTDVTVSPNELTTLNAKMETGQTLTGVTVRTIRYTKPLINPKAPGGTHTMTSEEIEVLPTLNTSDAASLGTGVYQGHNGSGLSLGGGRGSGTKYIIDGVQMNPGDATFTNLPPGSVDQIQTITSGLPARYGDASGGVINIVTKGVTATTRGGLWLEHSIDGYNNNQASFNLSGPLLRKKDSAGNKRPVLGYALQGSGSYNADGSPTYLPTYVAKQSVRDELEAHPLVVLPNTTGTPVLGYAAELLRADDFEQVKRRPNAEQLTTRLNGKLDYQLSDNINVTLGGFYGYNNYKNFSRNRALLSPDDGYSRTVLNTTRGYLRFSQRFGKPGSGADKDNAITNASYTIQADYQRDDSRTQDPNHKDNPFLYGYVGKFSQKFTPAYSVFYDTAAKVTAIANIFNFLSGVDFERSDVNPVLANYTSEYFRLTANQPASLSAIAANRGILNGGGPGQVYSIFSNVGTGQGGINKSLDEQVAITADASFDIKRKRTTHSIELGLYYQQRTERYYGLSGAGLWGLMRQLTNKVVDGSTLDYSSPTYVVNGQTYTLQQVKDGAVLISPNDTILYQPTFNAAKQGAFDANIRQQLFGDRYSRQYVQVDMLDPNSLSVNMFSADELLNGGDQLVTYNGYDYTGKLLTGQVNFNDFWTKKDANGYYTRPISAFRPNYIAGYLSDYIRFKDFQITLGVRAERFDLNTKVLKDPYSLYAVRKATSDNAANNLINGGKHPDNITSDYVVYVAQNTNKPTIVGYRSGDTWYDAKGREVDDPTILGYSSNGGAGKNAEPYLQDSTKKLISDDGFDPNTSFTDYKPQVNLMPRVNFSFPISDVALFYAHYDIVVQRPVTGYGVTPIDYYYFTQRAQQTIGNPDLKPEKLIDYEVGFQQKLSNSSAVTITAFYKERKDQIQVRPYYNAYPIEYFTYGNRDFSTTKGFSMLYDLRRTNHLAMSIAYTLQFVEGTGSSEGSATRGGLLANFSSAGLLNLRPVFPLDYDSRHIINVNMDYRYLDGEGPKIGSTSFLENAGLNLVFRTRSGEPYTRYAQAQTLLSGVNQNNRIIGSVGGARLPWHYGFDLRVDKDFALNFKKKEVNVHDTRKRGGLFFNAYLRVENLLNTKDVLGVYSYTGNSTDDGYLTSPAGSTYQSTVTNQASFVDLYRIALQNPGYFNGPRRATIGLQINF